MSTIRASLFALFCVFVIALFCRQAHQRPIKAVSSPVQTRTTPEPTIMSIRELQQALNDTDDPWRRYKCKVDGKWGSETAQALENYICDRQAGKEFNIHQEAKP